MAVTAARFSTARSYSLSFARKVKVEPGSKALWETDAFSLRFENEWMLVPGMAVVSVTGELPPLPGEGEPGPFSLEDEGRIRTVLKGAGFANVTVEAQPRQIVIAANEIEQFVTMAKDVGAIREALEKITDAEAPARIQDALREALQQRLDNGHASLSAAAWLVTATASS